MFRNRWGRRAVLSGVGAVGALALGVSAASAHHCFIPMYSLNSPTSANWLVFSAEDGAMIEAEYEAGCPEAVAAGYAALRAARLTVRIKIMTSKTIGDPKDVGRMHPNGANNMGLEYFGAESELPVMMVMTWMEGAVPVDCADA